ncbi:hypothetical protein [Salinirubrum litoreum]|uniref:DUF7979 domain-containing protein n=1 Tax=Salinirubrum litoreum TaxID=1126234 RepID=A0ABD5REN4_9EURY|nr:hypothetical protein [Salinirubrum litoreum]
MTHQRPIFRLRQLDSVPADATVHHYDELDEPTQTAISSAVGSGRAFSPEASTRVGPGDVVVFTGYFKVSA